MRIPCAGARNLLRKQYQGWRASVFLKMITSECANIPAFSYLGSSGLHCFILPKAVRISAHILSRGPRNWNKPRLINKLISPPKRIAFFTSRSSPAEGRSCGPTAGNPDRQFSALVRIGLRRCEKQTARLPNFACRREVRGWIALWAVRAALNRPVLSQAIRGRLPAIREDIRLNDTLRPIRMDQRIRRKVAGAI